MVKILSSVAIIFMILACGKEKIIYNNLDFGYEFLNDSYNSQTGTFIRKYANDTISIKIQLNADEKEKIITSFYENDFLHLPKEINCIEHGSYPIISQTVFLGKNMKTYQFSGDRGYFCFKGKRFSNIITTIVSIIENKPEIKNLEVSDIGYE